MFSKTKMFLSISFCFLKLRFHPNIMWSYPTLVFLSQISSEDFNWSWFFIQISFSRWVQWFLINLSTICPLPVSMPLTTPLPFPGLQSSSFPCHVFRNACTLLSLCFLDWYKTNVVLDVVALSCLSRLQFTTNPRVRVRVRVNLNLLIIMIIQHYRCIISIISMFILYYKSML